MELKPPRQSAYASRPNYARLLEEFKACDSVDAIDILMNIERQTIERFPESWEEELNAEYTFHRARIEKAQMEKQNAPS